MKKNRIYILAFILLFSFTNRVFAVPENVTTGQRTFNIGGVNKTVNVVTVDLNSGDMALEVVTANDKLSGWEDFQAMINRKKPIAAINANFFDRVK